MQIRAFGTVGQGVKVVAATASRLAVLFLLSFPLLISLAGSGNPTTSTPIQRLHVSQTSDGPIITGLFENAEYVVVPSTPCTCSCYAGSNNPQACQSNTREQCYYCYPCATASTCFDYQGDGACCVCTQTTGGFCVGCPRTGFGCGRGC